MVDGADKAVKSLTVSSILINLSFGMSLFLICGLINALQMMLYNPLANIRFPLNVMMLYGILLPISSLDLIPPEISTDLIFSMSFGTAYSEILEEMGYDSKNFIYNLGTMFYLISFMIIYLILIGFNYLVKYAFPRSEVSSEKSKSSCIDRIKRKLNIDRIVLLNNLFLAFFEGFIEILLSCYLNN